MKCRKCGCENAENARFCQRCGLGFDVSQSLLMEQMLSLLKDDLFTVLCILYSVSLGLDLINGGFPLLQILMTVFLWMVFGQRRKGIAAINCMRYISGAIFASYVIKWISYGIVALCGLLIIILGVLADTAKVWRLIDYALGSYFSSFAGIFSSATTAIWLLFAVLILVYAVVGMVFNVYGTRSIHYFAQSVYQSLESGNKQIVRCGAARIWLMVFGILDAVSAVVQMAGRDAIAFLSGGSMAAALIVGSILIGKYFVEDL